MKTLRYSSVVIVALAGLLTACSKSFLERAPQGTLTEEIVANKDGVNFLLIGAYAVLDGQGNGAAVAGGNPWEASPTNWIYGSVVGGDAHKGSNAGDQEPINDIARSTYNASNSFFNTKWKAVYEGVSRCNLTLQKMKQATDMTPAQKTQVEAEARFLRGHYYFELKKFFNKVPYVSDTSVDVRVSNDKDIWPFIEADFKFAADNLPDDYVASGEVTRANKSAAQAYLGKTYLYEKKYAEAFTLLATVVSSGKTSAGVPYRLSNRFEDNFDASKKLNNPEAVFYIEMTANDGTNTIANANSGEMLNFPYDPSPFGCCGFFQPSQDLVNSYRVDASGLPYLDDYNDHPVKSDKGITSSQAFVPDADPLDPRLDWTVGRRGLPYHDWGNHPGAIWQRDQGYGGPYSPKKMVYWKKDQDKYHDAHSWAPGSAINVNLIRFADVVLMYAEAAAQTGNLQVATDMVNKVRDRMKNNPTEWLHKWDDATKQFVPGVMAANYKIGDYPLFASTAYALKAIYFERKLELATEGHRFFDLSRWGIADQVLTAYYTYETTKAGFPDLIGAQFTKGKNEYFPIPQRQIDLTLQNGQPVLKQNAGY
ncbi:RagB/SusD family nutrient uptake outer membrane protein [Chitinophaga polysaccharea]|uniref:RagB/SusD family nutrient uptake outer membrane protein n=1 Tax=Chitinophaga TaxID=79328 RepID=UPI001454E657|nr:MULTISPECIES: RagB/SusD family nutrient uptake outer membrane protein [Chitinophaga]NLR56466.1 RagB/SusD family nutrient uptake outer membrane protein [Chitinophaga polysaccharea]NLU92697.1 RagB/SusD family nutrient uptake outer membrane protein [Chitinophaga sp. Ak27]